MTTTKRPIYFSLYFQVLTAIAIGIALGILAPGTAAAMKPFGEGFIKLIKMMIAPIIFCTVVLGISGTEDLKKVGRTGGLALLYFEVVSTLALIIGLTAVNLIHPGAGMNVDPHTLDLKAIASYAAPGKLHGPAEFLLDVIPSNFVGAFANGEILQVLLLSILCGITLQKMGARESVLYQWIEKGAELLTTGVIGKAVHVQIPNFRNSDAGERAAARAKAVTQRREEDLVLVARMTEQIVALFPRCPAEEACEIARHTAARGSGRVGRTAAGHNLEESALSAAVTAAVRHRHTEYDDLLAGGSDREGARQQVADRVRAILAAWSA